MTTTTVPHVAAVRRSRTDERRARVEDAIHDNEMEGAHVTPTFREDAERYITGEISLADWIAITRARYGLA